MPTCQQSTRPGTAGLLLVAIILPSTLLAQSTPVNPVPDNVLPLDDQTEYSPTRNILDSALPQSVTDKLFEQYGEAYGAYVAVRQNQWESDRIACSEDINDFLYNYIKRGRGDTPSTEWSKLLQPNFFQSRGGPWNDFDGDTLINSLPVSQDYNPTDGIPFKGDFDDWYDFGVPNKYNPLLQYVKDKYGIADGMMPIADFLASEGILVDGDDDGDSIADNQDPYPYFATYGDADLNRNNIGPTDMYYRLLDGTNPPKTNADLGGGLNYLLDGKDLFDGSYSGIDYAEIGKPDTGNPQQTVAEVGSLLLFSYNSSAALKQIRTFTAQTAFETEEIKKIRIDNCVRMADLQGIMGRLEFKELIADRVGRGVAKKQLENFAADSINYTLQGRDTDYDGEGDSSFLVSNLVEEVGRTRKDEVRVVMDQIPDSEAKTSISLHRSGTLKEALTPTLTPTETEVLVANLPNFPTITTNQKRGTVARIVSYFTAQASGNQGNNLGNAVSDPIANETYWQALLKINGLGPDNPHASYIFIRDELAMRQDEAEQNLREEVLAGSGYLPKKECLETTADGKGCKVSINSAPGSSFMESVGSIIKSGFDWLTGSDEVSDSVNTE